ncbi:hypothetical protein F511_43590 [Dorcoceras hygrometricum]|uniref:Uncharacterized protein n=1 Tax=Dorcoceras hygrometricum TaxID=472368 RepID=A0A2Z7ASY7_9LAMI|nr:hypothetical protein F511_43590 [Dorcoceras hygrometricum]
MADAVTSCCTHDWRTSSMERRACRGRVHPLRRARFRRWRPSAGRRSGDVMTAAQNSSRFWFGPVPGSP